MGKYSPEELETMEQAEPDKYYYYANEDLFRSLGIDLDNPQWDANFISIEGPQNQGEDKYAYFKRSVMGRGLRFLDKDGNLRSIEENPENINVERFKVETVAEKNAQPISFEEFDTLNEYVKPTEQAKPRGLGFGHWFMWVVTAGHWDVAAHRQYQENLKLYNDAMARHQRGLDLYKSEVLEANDRAKKTYSDFTKALKSKNGGDKKLTDFNEYERTAAEAERKAEESYRKVIEEIKKLKAKRKIASDHLDYFFGPERDADKARAVHDEIVKSNLMTEVDMTKIGDLKIPDGIKFTDREIAILGYAIQSSDLTDARDHTEIGKPLPDVDNRTMPEKFNGDAEWYARTEACFTHVGRSEFSHAASAIGITKDELNNCLAEYAEGKPEKLGNYLKEAILKSTKYVMYQTTLADTTSLCDFCSLTREMMALCANHADLKDIVTRGLTETQLKDAATVCNMSTVIDRGLDAQLKLGGVGDLGEGDRLDAIADVAALRLLQQTLYVQGKNFESSKEYIDTLTKCNLELAEATENARHHVDRDNPADVAEKQKILHDKGSMLQFINFGISMDRMGIPIEPSKDVNALFSGAGAPEKLHNMIKENKDLQNLSKASDMEIVNEMQNGKVSKYLKKLVQTKNENQPVSKNDHLEKKNVVHNYGPVK